MASDHSLATVTAMRHHILRQQLGSHASGGLLSGGLLSQLPSLSPDNMLLYGAVVVAARVWQFVPRPASAKKLVLLPVACLYLGMKGWSTPDPLGLAVFSVSMMAAILLGLVRGTTVLVWCTDAGEWMRQGTLQTLAIWGVWVAIRLGLDGLVYLHGPSAGVSSSSDLALLFGSSAAACNLVIWLKTGQHASIFQAAPATAR